MFLNGIAAVRADADFTRNDAVVWGWRVGLVVELVLFTAIRIAMGRPLGLRVPVPGEDNDASP